MTARHRFDWLAERDNREIVYDLGDPSSHAFFVSIVSSSAPVTLTSD